MFHRIPRLVILSVLIPVLIRDFASESKPSDGGQPLSPAEAIKKMTVPEGFTVELVAAEPDIVNPVAMTFDERGRIWITESLEYPRMSAGPGRDRVKVLESTKCDGRYDKITIFAEGLNIPSGIAVGHGGVWVANSPDILLYKEGPDGKAAGEPEVVVTGFGREDVHEVPNSLTWGPDGWLYGLNGVFNPSHVKHQGKEFKFTCALFRIHPKTREFQLFAEGTSNPWGLAFDPEGSAFVSACVIDHLWHLVETGYYIRQGGPYPPHTWPIGSIVKHKHQKAAYAGLCYFDSDAYPPEHRDRLYMGNIHGGCINVDVLERDGSTYMAKPAPDFLTANDTWFMPVSQKLGPDGCLYLLDWYDRYHCYHDAQRDPPGVDRLRGRLYRVRYKNSPAAGQFDLAKESDEQLIQRLHSPNLFFRDLALRLLCERNTPQIRSKLQHLALNTAAPKKTRMHAMWSLVGMGPLDVEFHLSLLNHDDASFRAWGVRAAGDARNPPDPIREKVMSMANDKSPDVQLQVVVAAGKVDGVDFMGTSLKALVTCEEDRLIPAIVWQNLRPVMDTHSAKFLALFTELNPNVSLGATAVLVRVVEHLLANPSGDVEAAFDLINTLIEKRSYNRQFIRVIYHKIHSGEVSGNRLERLAKRLQPFIAESKRRAKRSSGDLNEEITILDATLNADSLSEVRRMFIKPGYPDIFRMDALDALIMIRDQHLPYCIGEILKEPTKNSPDFMRRMFGSLGRAENAEIADTVLECLPKVSAELQPAVIGLLTQRATWGKSLLRAMAEKKIAPGTLNINQIRKLLAHKDPELTKQVTAIWGTLREERSPEREKLVTEMRELLGKTRGDAVAGVTVFKTACAQCHKLHGEGQDVGPDITANGRSDFEQLLSNVFDPSLVIGAGYQAVTVATTRGQIFTGLVVEDNAERVVLKQQGGQLETIPRGDIEEKSIAKVSLMPEGTEKQLKPQELADLFAFLALERPGGKSIPGTPSGLHGRD